MRSLLFGRQTREHPSISALHSSLTDHAHVQRNANRVRIRIVFFDSDIKVRIFSELRTGRSLINGVKVLIESPVMFEAIRPFLEALKTEPEIVPFSRYLVFHPSDFLRACLIRSMRVSGLKLRPSVVIL